ncbi:DUF3817 domain-containing protein [Streptomyces polygonati]|uniref:DUF3817 domain-containing protein n=1 Tax=Streptomyces polygonati TaxID=1617087 RepID=A0ABV8HGS2_9ACTN
MNLSRRFLRVSAAVELITLAILLANLATAGNQAVAGATGPIHGCAWLFGILAAHRDPHAAPRTTALAVVPGIGGLLALRRLNRAGELPSPPATAAGPV